MTRAIGSTGMFVNVMIGVSGRNDATNRPIATTAPATTSERNAAVIRVDSASGSSSSTGSNARKRSTMISSPAPAISVNAAALTVRTNCGITAGQAAELGLTESTPTIAHSGRSRIHSNAGATIAMPAAIRARAHVWRDAPCHSSATK